MKIARFFKDMTAAELSKKARLRQMKRAADIEDGRGLPTLEEVCKICNALGQPIDSMLYKKAKIKIEY